MGHLVQPSCPSRVTQSRLHRTTSSRGWNISREGDSTTSLGSLFQGSVTLRGKKFFLMFSWSFLCSSLCPLPLVPSSLPCCCPSLWLSPTDSTPQYKITKYNKMTKFACGGTLGSEGLCGGVPSAHGAPRPPPALPSSDGRGPHRPRKARTGSHARQAGRSRQMKKEKKLIHVRVRSEHGIFGPKTPPSA